MNRGTTSVPVPWQTTLINPAYRTIVNSWNIDLTVAARSVVAGSVTSEWAIIAANGTQPVTVGFVIEAVPGVPTLCVSQTTLIAVTRCGAFWASICRGVLGATASRWSELLHSLRLKRSLTM